MTGGRDAAVDWAAAPRGRDDPASTEASARFSTASGPGEGEVAPIVEGEWPDDPPDEWNPCDVCLIRHPWSVRAEYLAIRDAGCDLDEAAVFTVFEARVLRNTPYAIAGQAFRDDALRGFYERDGDWYRPQPENVALAPKDERCVARLRERERELQAPLPAAFNAFGLSGTGNLYFELRRRTRGTPDAEGERLEHLSLKGVEDDEDYEPAHWIWTLRVDGNDELTVWCGYEEVCGACWTRTCVVP